MECQKPLDVILSHLPPRIRILLERTRNAYEATVHEITLRSGRPLCIYCADRRYCLTPSGILIDSAQGDGIVSVTAQEMQEILMSLCDYSVYSRQEDLVKGYLTVSSGVRVGVCGTAVIKEKQIVNLRHISTLSFRIPREVKDCSRTVLGLIRPLSGALVCGAPCSGKTTLVRDMARVLSYSYKVSVIDERGELSAASSAQCGCDLGLSDVYVHMPKGEGIMSAVRSLSPDLIICDELGDEDDIAAVSYALRCGVAFIATVHAASIGDLRNRAVMRGLLMSGAFRYLIFLGDRRYGGRISRIYEWSADDA